MHMLPCHHKMIEDAHIDQRQGPDQRLRDHQIGVAGVWRAGRVVVGQQHARSVAGQRFLDYFAWIHAGVGQCTITSN